MIGLALSFMLGGALAALGDAQIELAAPAQVDRQRGTSSLGPVSVLTATVDNPGPDDLRVHSAALHFAIGPESVDAQYVVTRPELPVTVGAGESRVLTFGVRPWTTATGPANVTIGVTLRGLDVRSQDAQVLSATTSWRVMEGADLVLGSPSASDLKGYRLGLSRPRGVCSDGRRLLVVDWEDSRVLIHTPLPDGNQPSPTLVLGQPTLTTVNPNILGVSASSLSYPVGAHSDGRRLFVADTRNNRVLIWDPIPTTSFAPATTVLGQPDFTSNTPNNGGVTASTLNQPEGVQSDGTRLFVADTYNNRVLIWNRIPTSNGAPADLVLGQGLFSSNAPNNGGIGSATLDFPEMAYSDGIHLLIADTRNHRILVWNTLPSVNRAPADLVLGQPDFSSRTPNNGGVSGRSLSTPLSVQSDGVRVFVADHDNDRVLVWSTFPTTMNASASFVVGQWSLYNSDGGFSSNSIGSAQCAYSDGNSLYVSDLWRVVRFSPVPTSSWPAANQAIGEPNLWAQGDWMPGILTGSDFPQAFEPSIASGRLLLMTFYSRLLVWPSMPTVDNTPAAFAIGQPDLQGIYGNYEGVTARTLASPTFGCTEVGGRLAVSDKRNHRLLLFDSVPSASPASADAVFGQPTFTSNIANYGGIGPDSLNEPSGSGTDGVRFYLTDRNNNRVLGFDSLPSGPAASATVVLGQASFTTGNVNQGGLGPGSLNAPEQVKLAGGKVFVTDGDNNRILIWNSLPAGAGAPADVVIGQSDFYSNSPNFFGADPRSLKAPGGIDSDGERMVVADSGNNRILLWNRVPVDNATPADQVIGQPDFSSTRILEGRVSAFSTSGPRGLRLDGSSLYVVDNLARLLRYDLPALTRVRVSAGGDRTCFTGGRVELVAVASSTEPGPLTYSWSQTYGPAARLVESSGSTATYAPVSGGPHEFSVTVSDSGGVSGSARVHVLVNSYPVVATGGDRVINPVARVWLDARGSFDPDGDPIAYSWMMTGASAGTSIDNAGSALASFAPLPGTTYSVRLEASDGQGAVTTRDVLIDVRRDPVAVIFAPSATGGERVVRLDASTSSDPDGGTLSYTWTQLAGPGVTLRPSPASPVVTFVSPMVDARLDFVLTVSNPAGGRTSSVVAVEVDGTSPTATLAFPQGGVASQRGPFTIHVDFSEPIAIDPAPSIELRNGSGASSLSGGPLRPRLDDTDGTRFELAFDAAFSQNGTYTLLVSASDALGNPLVRQPTGNALTVDVRNRAPVAVAVGPSSATTGTTVTVDGSASSDPDQDSIAYFWSGTSPLGGSLTFSDPSSARTLFVPVLPGSHTVRLVVRDVNGASSAASAFSISVAAPGAGNRAPEASAGPTRFVAVGATVALEGTASDPDGDPMTFRWTTASAPPDSALPSGPLPPEVGGTSLSAFFTPDVPGTYSFVLEVADRFAAVTRSVAIVLVDDHANSPQSVGPADRLDSTTATLVATLEAPGDADLFSFTAAPGSVYRASLRCITVESAELAMLDSDGLSVIAKGVATSTVSAELPELHPPSEGTRFLRVTAADTGDTGTYRVALSRRTEVLDRPPGFELHTREAGGRVEATISTSGTSVPLSFVQLLTDYQASSLTLVGRSPESGASGFSIDAQQFSLPFVDTLLSAATKAHPLPEGPLVTLDFRAAPGSGRLEDGVRLLSVSATPPPPLTRVTTFRPTADAGLPLVLRPVEGGDRIVRLPDLADPGLTPRPFLRLDGRGSHDPNRPPLPLAYRWSVLAAPAAVTLSDPASPVPTVPLAGPGRYRFALTVSNGVLSSPTSVVEIRLDGAIHPPSADVRPSLDGSSGQPAPIGAPLVAPAGSIVTLDASGSTDADPSDRTELRYAWRQTAGPVGVPLPALPLVSFPAVLEGRYRFELSVTDPGGLSSPPAIAEVIVHDPADSVPLLSINAVSSSTSALGFDLGESPGTSAVTPLRVAVGSEITLQARASDPQFDGGSQTGLFFWRQLAGPAIRMAQVDTPPSKSRVTFSVPSAGVYEVECRVREASTGGVELGPETGRRIRVVAEDPAQPLPTPVATVRPLSPQKEAAPHGAADRSANVTVYAGSTVLLDGSGSTGGSSRPGFRWVPVAGPDPVLSDPLSPHTTFVVPDLGDGLPRRYTVQLYVDDADTGGRLGPPAPVVIESVPRPVAVTCATLPDAEIDRPFDHSLLLEGGLPPFTFELVEGALPPGLELDASTGRIAGKPTSPGSFQVRLAVTDSTPGVRRTDHRTYTLDVFETFELVIPRRVSLLALPLQPSATPPLATIEQLAAAAGAVQVSWTGPVAAGKGRFRTRARGMNGSLTLLEGGRGYYLARPDLPAARLALRGQPWPPEQYVRSLEAGLNLLAVPPDAAEDRTTSDLLALTGSGFAVYSGPPDATGARAQRVYLPGQPPVPLDPTTGYLLSVPSPVRVDLSSFTRP